MNLKKCCFSGHRILNKKESSFIKDKLKEIIHILINNGVDCFLVGGALGYDMIAEELILSYKSIYPHIKLILVLPCINQERYYSIEDKHKYNDIKMNADRIIYIREKYIKGCMLERNKYLVDSSDCLVCYLKKNTGGTFYTYNYAMLQNIKILNLFNIK